MTNRRELISGLLAAFVSLIIIGGSLAISFAENKPSISILMSPVFSSTTTSTMTAEYHTQQPGEPTLTPSQFIPTPTPTILSATPSCLFPTDWMHIIVNQGDTLESLAESYQTSPEELMEANCLFIKSIRPGSMMYVPVPESTQTLTITPRPTITSCAGPPSGWVLYMVQSGDTLYSLSTLFGISVSEIQAANCMGDTDFIQAGSSLWVPFIPPQTPTPSITSSKEPNPSDTPEPTRKIIRTRRPTRTPRP